MKECWRQVYDKKFSQKRILRENALLNFSVFHSILFYGFSQKMVKSIFPKANILEVFVQKLMQNSYEIFSDHFLQKSEN
jgi:hypothetical protein